MDNLLQERRIGPPGENIRGQNVLLDLKSLKVGEQSNNICLRPNRAGTQSQSSRSYIWFGEMYQVAKKDKEQLVGMLGIKSWAELRTNFEIEMCFQNRPEHFI
jgi:hypothetical protein